MSQSSDRLIVYADGSCLGNPGPGGWGVVILDPNGTRELDGADLATTNNRMEITAVIQALRALPRSTPVLIRTDSQYVIKTITDGWRRNKNQELWALLDAELKGRDVRFEWVRGHGNDMMNERADILAREAASGRRRSRSAAGSLVSNGGADSKPALAEALTPMLRPGERLARCAGCGRDFVAAASDQRYCSLVACQLAARRQS